MTPAETQTTRSPLRQAFIPLLMAGMMLGPVGALPAAPAMSNAEAATVAAEATAQLAPKLGRARSHTQRSLGYPDAGAVSLAMIARLVGDLLAKRN